MSEQNTERKDSTTSLAKECWDRLLEIYKARLAINTALSLALVTLTGYGLQTARTAPFLVAAMIPIGGFVVDSIIKWKYAAPFLYKLSSTEYEDDDPEPLSLLFLDFGRGRSSKYSDILSEGPSERRRKSFRRRYVQSGVTVRLMFYLGITVIEVFLAVMIRKLAA